MPARVSISAVRSIRVTALERETVDACLRHVDFLSAEITTLTP